MRRVLHGLGGALAILFGAAVLYIGIALVLGAVPVNRDFQPATDGVEIAVCSNRVHTDFVLPIVSAAVNWFDQFPPTDFNTPPVYDHVGIGWGDLDFYRSTPTWSDFRTGTALRALAGLGPSALHVQYRSGARETEDCRSLRIDAAQYKALADYIIASRAPGPASPGYGPMDAFYPAPGHFSLIKTCNVWIGQGLQAAGLPTGLWTPFSFQVLSHL